MYQGTITPEEFRLMLRKQGKLPAKMFSDDSVTQVFELVDSDGDGVMTIHEFVAWVQHGDLLGI